MRPLSFFEFLDAIGKQRLRAAIEGVSLKSPFPASIHEQALTQLKLYMMVGGLPEVVSTLSENVYNHQQAASILSSLLLNYEDDFNKYRGKIPELRLRDCLRAAAQQAGKKFVYRHAYVDAVSSQVHSACSLLEKAGLIVKVAHTSANGLPLGAEADSTKFKYALFDLGIYQKLSGFALRDAVTEETANFVHRGALSEIFVGNELLGLMPCTERAELWYWHRESRSSVAELDYVAECNNRVIPIEVKTGTRGRMKSMYRFLEEKKLPLGVRLCAENFSKYDNILVVPLYATGRLAEILEDS
jgi:predicted AAA+ superfamily ATPase